MRGGYGGLGAMWLVLCWFAHGFWAYVLRFRVGCVAAGLLGALADMFLGMRVFAYSVGIFV
jgi:hypothetical protein